MNMDGKELHMEPQNSPQEVERRGDSLSLNWLIQETAGDLYEDDMILTNKDGTVAEVSIGGQNVTFVWSKGTSRETINITLNKLKAVGYSDLDLSELGNGKKMATLKLWVEEKGFPVVRDPLLENK